MSAREFSKVSPALWRSSRFINLSDRGKIGYVYLLTNAHVNSGGIYVLPEGYACSDLKWTSDELRIVFEELISVELIDRDEENDVILIERWFRHNPPMNDKHATGTTRLIAEIESERLREKALASLQEADAARLERQAAREAERAAERVKKQIEGLQHPASGDRLLRTGFMQRVGR